MKAGAIQRYFRKAANANDPHSACNKENKHCDATAAVVLQTDTKKQEVVCISEDDENEVDRQPAAADPAPQQGQAHHTLEAHVPSAARKRQQPQDDATQQQVACSLDTASKRQRQHSTADASSMKVCSPCSRPRDEATVIDTPVPKQQSLQTGTRSNSHAVHMRVDQATEEQGTSTSQLQLAPSQSLEQPGSQPATATAAAQHANVCTTPNQAGTNQTTRCAGETAAAPISQQQAGSRSASYSVSDVEAIVDEARAALCLELLLPTSNRRALASDGSTTSAQPGSQQEQERPHGLSQAEAAALLEGRTCGLQQLVALLVQQGAAGAFTPATEAGRDAQALRETILMLAGRKAYGAQDGASEPELEGSPPSDVYWFWELRDHKKTLAAVGPASANKLEAASVASAALNNRKLADVYRKRRKELHELLLAACHLRDLLAKDVSTPAAPACEGAGNGSPRKKVSKAQEKEREKAVKQLQKATDKLSKLHNVEQIEAALQAGIAALNEKDAHRLAQMSSKQQERQEAKIKRDAERLARAAEKAKEAEAKAAEKEARAAEKAREAAAKAQKAAEKEAKAAGFGNKKELGKCQGIMASFFKMGAAKTPAGKVEARSGGAGMAMSPPTGSFDTLPQTSAGNHAADGSQTTTPHATAVKCSALKAQSVCLEADMAVSKTSQLRAELDDVMEKHVQRGACHPGPDILCRELRDWCKVIRQQAWRRRPEKGVPPSWQQHGPAASTSTAVQVPLSFHARCVALFGEDYQPAGVRVLHRKLLAFADSVRPAFYGNWPNSRSAVVRGRRPHAQDPRLDYEVQSDQEWEEEPEGTDLEAGSDEEVSEVRGGADDEEEEEEGGGFVVDDGYLSGDEGIHLEGADMEVDGGAAVTSGRVAMLPASTSDVAVLEHAVVRQLQSNTPLLLCSLPGVTTHPPSTLNPALLRALAGTVLRPGVVLTPPQELDIYTAPPPAMLKEESNLAAQQAAAAAAGAISSAGAAAVGVAGTSNDAASGPSSGAGRRPQLFPEQLQPLLERYLQHTKDRAVDKVVDGFLGYIGQGPLAGTAGTAAADSTGKSCVAAAAACAELGLTLPLPHCSKKALKERIHMTGAYHKSHGGWIIHPVLATPTRPSGSNKLKTPGSNKPHPFVLMKPSPSQPAQHATTPAPTNAQASTCPPSTGGTMAGPLPTPLANAAANQLLAGMQAAAAGCVPAGAPTPWPTPHTTIPAAGGAAPLTAVAAAMDRTLPSTVDPHGAYHYRYAPPPAAAGGVRHACGSSAHGGFGHHAQGAAGGASTPLTPIPCPLADADVPQPMQGLLLMPTPATVVAVPHVPANTPATLATGATGCRSSVQQKAGAGSGSRFGLGQVVDLHQAAARVQQALGAAAGSSTPHVDMCQDVKRARCASSGAATGVEHDDEDTSMVDAQAHVRGSTGSSENAHVAVQLGHDAKVAHGSQATAPAVPDSMQVD